MRTRTTLAFMMAAGLAATPATAQDTGAISGGESATRSPSTTPIDAPPATNRGVVGNERPGAPGVPRLGGTGTLAPGGAMLGRPGAFVAPANATFDQLFAAAASSAGISEVAMSRIAAQRSGSDEVRLFAQRMIGDHSKANNELINLATSKAMGVPMSLEIRDRAEEAILLGKSGEAFDKAYIHQQLAAHMCAVALFEAEAERGQDPQLRAWAAKMVPALKEHKMMVKRMHDELEARHTEKSASPLR